MQLCNQNKCLIVNMLCGFRGCDKRKKAVNTGFGCVHSPESSVPSPEFNPGLIRVDCGLWTSNE